MKKGCKALENEETGESKLNGERKLSLNDVLA